MTRVLVAPPIPLGARHMCSGRAATRDLAFAAWCPRVPPPSLDVSLTGVFPTFPACLSTYDDSFYSSLVVQLHVLWYRQQIGTIRHRHHRHHKSRDKLYRTCSCGRIALPISLEENSTHYPLRRRFRSDQGVVRISSPAVRTPKLPAV